LFYYFWKINIVILTETLMTSPAMPKSFLIFFVVFILTGCQYFEKQVPEKDELLQKELQNITWEVDSFPSVEQCDSIADKDLHKQCFIDFLTQNIQQRISADTLSLRFPE